VALIEESLRSISEDEAAQLAMQLKTIAKRPHSLCKDKGLTVVSLPYGLVEKYLFNLHPLIGFADENAQIVALDALAKLEANQKMVTLRQLEEAGTLNVRIYRPGQYREYRTASSEVRATIPPTARYLFASKFGKMGRLAFEILSEDGKHLRLRIRGTHLEITVSRSKVLPSLRSYSGVDVMDMTDRTESVIADEEAIPEDKAKLLGLRRDSLKLAVRDIKAAYRDIAGTVLLIYKVQIPSPGLYWIGYFSKKPVLTTDWYSVKLTSDDADYAKILTVWVNSLFGIIQVLALRPEVRAAWSRLDKRTVWNHFLVPDPKAISAKDRRALLACFNSVSKSNAPPLHIRLKERHQFQRLIDTTVLDVFFKNVKVLETEQTYESLYNELSSLLKLTGVRTRR